MAQDFNEIMEAAKKIQEQMKQAQHDIAAFKAKGGSQRHCEVEIDGKHRVRKITLNKDFIKEEPIEFIEEMISSAFNKAVDAVEEEMKSQMMNMTKDLGIDMDKLKEGDTGANTDGDNKS
jgi:nucleoid-associated protein EbfC